MQIPKNILIKKSNLPLIEKLLFVAKYLDELELAENISNYINMEKSYKKMADELLQMGFKIPESNDITMFFKKKILDMYFDQCDFQVGFVGWLV